MAATVQAQRFTQTFYRDATSVCRANGTVECVCMFIPEFNLQVHQYNNLILEFTGVPKKHSNGFMSKDLEPVEIDREVAEKLAKLAHMQGVVKDQLVEADKHMKQYLVI
jgi:hypothetical protein